MNDQEINRKLALALGWPDECILTQEDGVVRVFWGVLDGVILAWWREFNYRHWRTIGPIAQRYDCFPRKNGSKWQAYVGHVCFMEFADTPQKSIALAVIAAHEAGVLE